jgi:hypothetical protein
MVANGTNPDNVDEETFRQICVMYADGMIGNRVMLETLGNLTAGVYNYMRANNHKVYTLRDIIGKSFDYLYPPQDNTETVNSALLAFVSQAKGFNPDLFKKVA